MQSYFAHVSIFFVNSQIQCDPESIIQSKPLLTASNLALHFPPSFIYRSRSRDRRRSRSRDRGGYGSSYGGGGGGGGGGRRSQAGASLRKPRWDLSRLEPFKKDFYVASSTVTNRHDYEVEEWRKAKEISLKGKGIPNPVLAFEEGNFPDYVLVRDH